VAKFLFNFVRKRAFVIDPNMDIFAGAPSAMRWNTSRDMAGSIES